MEEAIATFNNSMATFCTHLDTSCNALKRSLDRRPVPLDSASSTFLRCLNRRISDTASELNTLDSMAMGTVSFEELLGHCNEVYKKNQSDLILLQDRLNHLGYFPQIDIEDSEDELPTSYLDSNHDLTPPSFVDSLEDDSLMDESFSLKKLGVSDVCLATLASQANANIDDFELPSQDPLRTPCPPTEKKSTRDVEGNLRDDLKFESPTSIIEISKDDYENLPSYMKGLTSWEDLLKAVDKINSCLGKKANTKGSDYFHQDEIASLDLGPKARSYLLLLVRMNRLVVETIDGLISYKAVSLQKQ